MISRDEMISINCLGLGRDQCRRHPGPNTPNIGEPVTVRLYPAITGGVPGSVPDHPRLKDPRIAFVDAPLGEKVMGADGSTLSVRRGAIIYRRAPLASVRSEPIPCSNFVNGDVPAKPTHFSAGGISSSAERSVLLSTHGLGDKSSTLPIWNRLQPIEYVQCKGPGAPEREDRV
jgi:hypothetical protein